MTLTERIDQAIDRIIAGHSPQRIPADLTDPDLVLVECRERIAELESALRDLVRVVSNQLARGENEPGDFEAAWKRAVELTKEKP